MKKFIFAALAATVIASPAAAQNWQGKTYSPSMNDAEGWYNLSAEVDTFCQFGAEGNGQGTSNVVSANAEADGNITFDIQNDDDNTIQSATATYNIPYAVCNTPFDLKVQSSNGGLFNNAFNNDNDFTPIVPYSVALNFDGVLGSTPAVGTSEATIGSSLSPKAGQFTIKIDVASADRLLLEGTYSDKLIVKVFPNT